MITKQKIKKEIDEIPDDLLEEIYQFINSLKKKKNLHTFKLKGQFDELNIRQAAYE